MVQPGLIYLFLQTTELQILIATVEESTVLLEEASVFLLEINPL